MSRYNRHNPEEPVRHDWTACGRKPKAQGSLAAPIGSAATITGLQALLHCELWARSDMNMADDKRAYEHRLRVINMGIEQLQGKQQNAGAEPPTRNRG
jgi:hypothetical protein